jgi:hypothetical protein
MKGPSWGFDYEKLFKSFNISSPDVTDEDLVYYHVITGEPVGVSVRSSIPMVITNSEESLINTPGGDDVTPATASAEGGTHVTAPATLEEILDASADHEEVFVDTSDNLIEVEAGVVMFKIRKKNMKCLLMWLT